MFTMRAARAFTGRPLVAKFEHSTTAPTTAS